MMEALLRASRGETPEETPLAVVVDTSTEEMKAGFVSFDRGTGLSRSTKSRLYATRSGSA